eukprot:g18280.t1
MKDTELVADMQRILVETKKKYDEILVDGERKQEELTKIRDAIRLYEEQIAGENANTFNCAAPPAGGGGAGAGGAAGAAGAGGGNMLAAPASGTTASGAGTTGTTSCSSTSSGGGAAGGCGPGQLLAPDEIEIEDLEVSKKVYRHVLERSRKELAALRQRLFDLENALKKKSTEQNMKAALARKLTQTRQQKQQELEKLAASATAESDKESQSLQDWTEKLDSTAHAINTKTLQLLPP